ncbi:MAG: hypothetical protein LBR92_01865 [Puniceicoccales bacterium]|nr:hypothetical protein [Puniceicoccales bacterium]
MRIYVHTHGCRLNVAESRSLVETLESAGCDVVCAMDQSIDIVAVNSCVFLNFCNFVLFHVPPLRLLYMFLSKTSSLSHKRSFSLAKEGLDLVHPKLGDFTAHRVGHCW